MNSQKLYQTTDKRRKKRRNRFILFSVCLALLLFGGHSLLQKKLIPAFKRLPFFQFKQVVFEPTEHISLEEMQVLVGVPSRENLFELNLNRIKGRVKRNVWILDLKVTRLLPHSVRIDVVEKKPVAIVRRKKLFFMDAEAQLIAPIRPYEQVNFPVISATPLHALKDRSLLLKLFHLIQIYEENAFMSQWALSEVHWNKKSGVTLFTVNPSFEIRLGFDPFKKKMDRLGKVIQDLYEKDIQPLVVDLNYSKKVVVKRTK